MINKTEKEMGNESEKLMEAPSNPDLSTVDLAQVLHLCNHPI